MKTLIIPNEKAPEGANSVNGASDGIELQPIYQFIAEELHKIQIEEMYVYA